MNIYIYIYDCLYVYGFYLFVLQQAPHQGADQLADPVLEHVRNILIIYSSNATSNDNTYNSNNHDDNDNANNNRQDNNHIITTIIVHYIILYYIILYYTILV